MQRFVQTYVSSVFIKNIPDWFIFCRISIINMIPKFELQFIK